jgi:hypothetical protein
MLLELAMRKPRELCAGAPGLGLQRGMHNWLHG